MERFADPIVLAVMALAFAIGFAVRGDGSRKDDGPRPQARVVKNTRKSSSNASRSWGAGGLDRLTAQDWVAIDEELYGGRKISAIKLIRAAAGFGLKEAKDAVEARARELGVR